MDQWKERFKSHTMRTNFLLGLTRTQMEYLSAVADDVEWDRFTFGSIHAPNNFIATKDALERRGLIERKKNGRGKWSGENIYEIRSCETLTPAGELVVKLLKVCGIFIESDNISARRYAGKRK